MKTNRNGRFSHLTVFLLGSILLSPLSSAAQNISDPFEGVNRGIFWFNNQVDEYILEPVSKAYTWTLPSGARRSVGNFFSNLKTPVFLLSDITQGKFDQAGTHTGRFILNSTFGLAGLFDVAEDVGFEFHNEDFGSALGYHGIGAGPYLMLPFLGPSSVRDLGGLIVDSLAHPLRWASFDSSLSDDVDYSILALGIIEIVETKASLQQAIDASKEASVDYYSFVRNSYWQRRQGLIYDGLPPDDEFEDEDWDEDNTEDDL